MDLVGPTILTCGTDEQRARDLTPRGHVRASYRNFWPPETQFQMTGVRVARDLT
jgi:formylglycine-generating enzyme required for sulfatase activity